VKASILALLFLSTVINYIDRQALSVILPQLRGELGLSSADYGNITFLFMIAYTIGQIGMGGWIDRVGTRIGFAVSITVWSVAAMAHALANSAGALMGLRFLLGLGESGNWPAGGKAISECMPKEERALGMALFDGGSAVGAIAAPPLVAWLVLTYNWRVAFLVTGALGLIWLVFWLRIYRPLLPAGPPTVREGWFEMLRYQSLWGLMVTRFFATPIWWFYVFWLPDYLSKGRGFSLREIGLFAWIPYLTVDLGKMLGGATSDRLLRRGMAPLRARKTVMTGGALCMLGGLMVVGAPDATMALFWVSVATFGFGLWSANILALHADVFVSSRMARAIGWTGTAASLSGALFTWLVGQMVDRLGYGPAFASTGVVAVCAYIALLTLVRGNEEQS
jgi:MFS transporter, ACS family, hexuronate transporter